jgi:small-conductance mechanosensitive channel
MCLTFGRVSFERVLFLQVRLMHEGVPRANILMNLCIFLFEKIFISRNPHCELWETPNFIFSFAPIFCHIIFVVFIHFQMSFIKQQCLVQRRCDQLFSNFFLFGAVAPLRIRRRAFSALFRLHT